jgi:dGTPase
MREHAYHELLTYRRKEINEDLNGRKPYQRDIDRIVYSDAFQRLKHKTQVFFLPKNDHVCTRLEHVLYVSQASAAVARTLGLDEDLARAIGLAHDIGHAPFGHHGESVFREIIADNEVLKKQIHFFRHETNSLRVLDEIALINGHKESGLNLTLAVRDGVLCHNGEDQSNHFVPRIVTDIPMRNELEQKLNCTLKEWPKDLGLPSTYEGCIVRIVDKIAYTGRDIEDAFTANILDDATKNEYDCFFQKEYTNFYDPDDTRCPFKNGEFISYFLKDLCATSANGDAITLSDSFSKLLASLIELNYEKIYKHERVKKFKEQAKRGIRILFDYLLMDIKGSNKLKDKSKLPDTEIVYPVFEKFIQNYQHKNVSEEMMVLDFIAGMTDNYLLRCISELFVPQSIV